MVNSVNQLVSPYHGLHQDWCEIHKQDMVYELLVVMVPRKRAAWLGAGYLKWLVSISMETGGGP